jgi:SAM-dependent methyltransferase
MPEIIAFPERASTATRAATDPVRVAYDALAPAYDAFTADYRYDLWLQAIEGVATRHGLRGRRLLDLACGTGKSFLPLLERGYTVTACDVSPEMAARAARKAPSARVLVADMRALPTLGSFDLITCLDDALNYLLHRDDLARTLSGISARLARDGLAIWDLNTLGMVRSSFSTDWVADRGEWFLAWSGSGSAGIGRGGVVEARIDAFRHRGGSWSRSTSRHRQRHWPPAEILQIATECGLEVVDVLGQHRGARLEADLDEHTHIKALYVARRTRRAVHRPFPRGGVDMIGGI